ncbi:uncharacterized protein LOC120291688 [Eucalyptus grandis]|uniref:uncharacterized protein LOC120291688 n=1 Tax=Eucalyptus grandis TaxID=71139 RepID=UPI00192F0D39|nr:uncharacterized protein LOC120291688 [Eucalyptus grandis]
MEEDPISHPDAGLGSGAELNESVNHLSSDEDLLSPCQSPKAPPDLSPKAPPTKNMEENTQDKPLVLPPDPPPPGGSSGSLSSRRKPPKGGCWNIRGMVDSTRQAEIRNFITSNHLCCVGLVEIKVPQDRFNSISEDLLRGWCWTANYDFFPRGRIWVGWDPMRVKFETFSLSKQAIHGNLETLDSGVACCVSFVYGDHSFSLRRPLWEDIIMKSTHLRDTPWLVLGDFNAIKDPSDRVGGSEDWLPCFNEFGQCLEQAELEDLRFVGFRYTWTTSSGHTRKARKIDGVLVNAKWSLDLSYSEASFLPPGISDHSPMVVKILNPTHTRKPFKFFDFWMKHPEFKEIVSQVWNEPGNGFPMYKLVSKLKALKCRLKQLNRDSFSNISARTLDARKMMEATQAELQLNPFSTDLAEVEKSQRCIFASCALGRVLLQQKSGVRWLKEGDRNTKFFHQYVNKRQLRNRVLSVLDSSGNILTEPHLVQRRFVEFFEDLLMPQEEIIRPSLEDLREVIQHPLSIDQAALLAQPDSRDRDPEHYLLFAQEKGSRAGWFHGGVFKENGTR